MEALGVPEILGALEIDCGAVTQQADTYLVIPGNSGPRWLIPAESQNVSPVLSAWRPYSVTGQVKWLAIRMAARAGIVRYFPSVSDCTVSRGGLLRWFERCGIRTQAAEMVILVGNPSPDRKLIVFLLDAEHRVAAVLKAGLTPGGRLSVLREAGVLGKLEGQHLAPRVLSIHANLGAAAQEYVDGTLPDRGFRPEYLEMLCRLPRSGASRSLRDAAAAMESRFRPWAHEVQEAAPELLGRCLSCLDLDLAVPTMLVHGDFVAWNIRQTPRSGYVLVDWEWANFAGLPLHDLLHFQFSEDRLFGGKVGGYAGIAALPVCREYLRRMNLDPALLPRLAILYLLDRLAAHFNSQDPAVVAYLLGQLGSAAGSLG
jgi:hypothetical protein